ncbi:hypothetical protein [Rhodococcus opacus]|uniref:hypothetical protein n=1 Tax=Rhodococcus opacus TaxID=37919 RepID=UPI00389A3847
MCPTVNLGSTLAAANVNMIIPRLAGSGAEFDSPGQVWGVQVLPVQPATSGGQEGMIIDAAIELAGQRANQKAATA